MFYSDHFIFIPSMTNQNSLKRLWTEYNKLKNWAESTNPVEFTVENCSLGENETSLLSENENIVTIIGLIYPRTEPFTECVLRIEIHVPITYPQTSLQVYIKTNISHPNIDKNGNC